jgi:ADP-heptose:LPS heptosyltransferase
MISHTIPTVRRILGFLIFYVVDFLAIRPAVVQQPQTLLLVRLDVLGDYILFRNFITELSASPQYKGYRITLCTNQALREFVESFDHALISDFVWVDRERLVYSIPYRFCMLRRIRAMGFVVAINSQYSREFFHGDSIVRASRAGIRIGSTGDLNNMDRWQKILADRYYTLLQPAANRTVFEFYRNRDFFAAFLNTGFTLHKPTLATSHLPVTAFSGKAYVVLHPGARLAYRQWRPGNFAKVANYLASRYGLDIVLVGSHQESGAVDRVVANMKTRNVTNLVGKTAITELCRIIAEAKLMVANDTGTAHIAAAVNTPVVVISNGNHFGRFIPYPPEVSREVYAVFPDSIAQALDDPESLATTFRYYSDIDINTVPVNAVLSAVDRALQRP